MKYHWSTNLQTPKFKCKWKSKEWKYFIPSCALLLCMCVILITFYCSYELYLGNVDQILLSFIPPHRHSLHKVACICISAPMGAWKCNFPTFLRNHEAPTDQPTD